MLRFMYFEVDYLICLSRQNFRSQTKKYSSSGCTIDFNIYIGEDAARGLVHLGLGIILRYDLLVCTSISVH